MKKLPILLVSTLLGTSLGFIPNTYAFFNTLTEEKEIQINIGSWRNSAPLFDINNNYEIGDQFQYNNSIWIITGSWFDSNQFLNPDGMVNFSYVRPYGPVNENTNEYRAYNTYYADDIVTYNGHSWVVLHGGANSAAPGSDTTAWNRIGDEWFKYNTYFTSEIVLYEGSFYRAKQENRNRIPNKTVWAWELI